MLKHCREDADLTRKQAADALGWTVTQVKNLEIGKKTCTAEDLVVIADLYRIDPAELIRRIQP